MSVTYYVALPFGRSEDGIMAGQAQELPNELAAIRRAEALSRQVEREDAPNSPEDLLAAYYDFLTWMSESLTLAVMRKA